MHSGLSLLARLRRRGWWRGSLARARTPRDFLLIAFGAGMALAWVAALVVGGMNGGAAVEIGEARGVAMGFALAVCVLSMAAGITHRGVYLPPEELEVLLSAPVSRGDILRYRLRSAILRTLPSAILVGIVLGQRMPQPIYAWPIAASWVLCSPILAQGLSLLLAAEGSRRARWAQRVPTGLLRVAALLILIPVLLGVVDPEAFSDSSVLDLSGFLNHRFVAVVALPLTPWVRGLTATSPGQAIGWGACCFALCGALFATTVRIKVDYREACLTTSRNLAKRRARVQAGGSVSALELRPGSVGLRAPWWGGVSPVGSVIWMRSTEILRHGSHVLLMAAAQLGLVVSMAVILVPDVLAGSVMVLVLGTFQLSNVLRTDLRGDLERLAQHKAWPLGGTSLFLASILPSALLTGSLVGLAVVLRGLLVGGLTGLPVHMAIGLFALPLSLLWFGVENALFLVKPVRHIPGQVGSLQSMGRLLLHSMMSLALVLLVILPAVLSGIFVEHYLGADGRWIAGFVALIMASVFFVLVARGGGWALGRFDPSGLVQ